jgi:uncharacterized cupredoxin-like copper-binding protein
MKKGIVLACIALAALAFAAIGGATAIGKKKSLPHTALALKADPNGDLTFNKSSLSAKKGFVTITMANPRTSGTKHGVAVEGKGVDESGKVVKPGKESTVTVKLTKTGNYTFFCPFDGHRAAGMKGHLTIH